ncbi:PaaI family thioesterase [Sphingomonas sp. AOB5]|uniref:PaaI family thioesterase n=1 Tax=Sphingomonas sp. AOB5 TaxID=3034017 RepID=UPI0023FA178F|nr:PaaI family thioesterase [Sphingomonas sp. AOB5]MDF7777687.1 PaaI family thioesterase [Sphingomonas sp. AOB5]
MSDPFHYYEDPDAPGWMRWELREAGRFNSFLGHVSTRLDGDAAIVRMMPRYEHSNLLDKVHGGALLGFVDVALFGAARSFGVLAGPAVTIDISAQFVGAAALDVALDARVELLRETGRLLFLRGLIVQQGETVASFTGTIRKFAARTASPE